MRKLVVAVTSLVAVLGSTVAVAVADPGLSNVSRHQHFINGQQVGPDFCANPNLQNAFNQFHANLHSHLGVTGEIGPQAPGLHDGQGGEITAAACPS